MSKVLVDRELLERIVNTNMADYAVIAYQRKEIRFILEAKPAEAEGVEVIAYAAPNEDGDWQMLFFDEKEAIQYVDDEPPAPLVLQSAHIAALSAERARADVAVADANDAERALVAVTAERDRLQQFEALRKDATGRAAFKNFHRSLCERFGYTHDDEFWWRDLISLEEHIAKLTAPQPVSSALADVAADSLADGCRGIAGLDHRFTPGPFSGARYCSKCGVAEDPDAARAAMRTYLGLDSEDV